LGDSIRLDLTDPWSSGFAIKSIDGLGPSKANINTTELASNDGAIYNSSKIRYRNIVLTFIFLENSTIEETRLLSYKYFPVKHEVTLAIETDNRNCKITGYVESNEPSIFNKQETCTISLICPDPFFYSVKDVDTTFYGTDPNFEFPFDSEANYDFWKWDEFSFVDGVIEKPIGDYPIEFGIINNLTKGVIYYAGDVETGMTITIHSLGDATGLVIYNILTRETMAIDDDKLTALTGSGIQAGDDIIITTSKGKKGIVLLRDGVTTNILNVLKRPIDWFQLSKGENVFVYDAETGLTNLQFNITSNTVYEGV
jgi:hypothetical protein